MTHVQTLPHGPTGTLRRLAVVGVLLALTLPLGAQQFTDPVGEPVADQIGVTSADQLLQTLTVTNFEDASFWRAEIASDQGIIQVRRLPGGPAEKEELAQEIQLGISSTDEYVLGLRVDFFKRGYNHFAVRPARPIPIEGITKTMSIWVVGRNFNHVLKLLISDFNGDQKELTVGRLNFTGWKRLTVAIPPTVSQTQFHFLERNGIKFEGFKIEVDPMEASGTYYIYFDGLRAITDLFAESVRDTDDIPDGW